MWIFTTKGFISLVVDKREPSLMHVRARVRDDILAHFPDAKVETWPGSDYLYRAILPRSEVAAMMWDEVMTADVRSHFKDEAIRRSAKPASGARSTAYYAIWGAMAQLQPIAPYQKVPRGSNVYPAKPAGTGTFRTWSAKTEVNMVWEDEALLRKPTQRATSGHYDWSTHPDSALFNEPETGEDLDASDPAIQEALRRIDAYEDAAAAAGADRIIDGAPVDFTTEAWDMTDQEWDDLYAHEHADIGPATTPKMRRRSKKVNRRNRNRRGQGK